MATAAPAAGSGLLDEIKKLTGLAEAQGREIAELKKLSGTPAGGAPFARRGENALTSRGYSYLKLLGTAPALPADQVKVELDLHNQHHKELVQHAGYEKAAANSIIAPFSTKHLAVVDGNVGLINETKALVNAGIAGLDPAELAFVRQKYAAPQQKALSYYDESAGASLIAPPVMGEMIDLFRNNEVFLSLGARDIGMPPNGRISYPRHTGAATAYFVGASDAITSSNQTTGDLILTAKKLGVLCKLPNELFRFASVAVEQFVREDIAKVSALRLDLELLQGVGSSYSPKGLINYSGVQAHTAGTLGANGNTLQPEDVGTMIGKVGERNAEFTGWAMRPLMYSKLVNRRADGPIPGDGRGPFLFNMWRGYDESMNRGRGKGILEGYPVCKSSQVSNAREKGSASNLTYVIGGDWTDYIMALGGVIEFLVATQGDTMVANDQTWVRGIQFVDGAPRHEASFIWCDDLLVA